jgi:hypothetical protein
MPRKFHITTPLFYIFAGLNYKMNLNKSFLLFQEIVVSKKSLFWTGYLALNALLQRKIARQGLELMLQIGLPRTLGQMNIRLYRMNLSQYLLSEPLGQLNKSWREKVKRVFLMSEPQFQLVTEFIHLLTRPIHLPQCPGQAKYLEKFTINSRF